MEILITGGTGFLGRALTARLVAEGHEVRRLARSASPRDGAAAGDDGYRRGSVLEPATLPPALEGCSVVIHLVGIISEVGGQTYERVHVDGTRHLLAAGRAAGVTRWIQVSAIGARPDAPARYHRSKWAAEELVRGSELAWTILRPSLVHGPGDGFTRFFARMSRWSPVLPLMGGGHSRVQPIAVADVVEAVVAALARPSAIGKTYDLVGPRALTWRAVLEEILRGCRRRRWLVTVPWTLARWQAGFLEWAYPTILRQAPPLNRDQLRMLAEDNVGDPGPAERELGIRPRAFSMEDLRNG